MAVRGAGAPTLRDPAGVRVLAAGDLVCFPSGRDGAHAIRGPGRVVMFSGAAAAGAASVSVYPDSEKLGGELLGGTVYEFDPGERNGPYHYEIGNEECLLVLAGTPTLSVRLSGSRPGQKRFGDCSRRRSSTPGGTSRRVL